MKNKKQQVKEEKYDNGYNLYSNPLLYEDVPINISLGINPLNLPLNDTQPTNNLLHNLWLDCCCCSCIFCFIP
jgi:hypothetical protein